MDQFKLPTAVAGKTDINRLLRELNALDDFFVGAAARQPGTSMNLPKLTPQLDAIARDNNLNLIQPNGRKQLTAALNQILQTAPCLHISFATEPSLKALERILIWMRQNIHRHVLLQVGLQPAIAAGCVLRTPNKLFDMSLRANLKKQQGSLVRLISGAVSG